MGAVQRGLLSAVKGGCGESPNSALGSGFLPLSSFDAQASHTAHIANATFSSLFVGAISVPDFDMFQVRRRA